MNPTEVREYVREVTESWLDEHVDTLTGMTQAEVLRALAASLNVVISVMEGDPT